MQIAKIAKSGRSITVEMPEGLDLAEGDFEVRFEGDDLRLLRVKPEPSLAAQWTWLDSLTPVDQDFLDAMERIEAEDIAMAALMKPPAFE